MLAGCDSPAVQRADTEQLNGSEIPAHSMPVSDRETFFPLTSLEARSVLKCRSAASAFDTQRTPEQAKIVAAACEADANDATDSDCAMYAVSVASGAEKFIGQIEAIRADRPANPAPVKIMQERAAEHAPKCRV